MNLSENILVIVLFHESHDDNFSPRKFGAVRCTMLQNVLTAHTHCNTHIFCKFA